MDNSTRPKTRLRWYQFHLRTLLVFVLVAGMLLGWLGICLNRARQQRAAVIRIRELGGEVAYEAVSFPGSTLLHKIAGEDMAANVIGVTLGRDRVTDGDLAHLRALNSLRTLYLGSERITDKGLEHLISLTTLRTLQFSRVGISDAGLHRLAVLRDLERLGLSATDVTDAGLECLKSLPSLRHIEISDDDLTDDGMQHLAAIDQLEVLELSSRNVTDAGLACFRHHANLAEVRFGLHSGLIHDAGLSHLGTIPGLRELHIWNYSVTIRVLEEFLDARPNLSTSIGFSEGLYYVAGPDSPLWKEGSRSPLEPTSASLDFYYRIAAQWKLECARFKQQPERAALAAYRQLVSRWEQVAHDRNARASANADFTQWADALVALCALARAKLRLAVYQGDKKLALDACREGLALAESMHKRSESAYRKDPRVAEELVTAMDFASEFRVALANLTGDTKHRRAALAQTAKDCRNLADTMENMAESDAKYVYGAALSVAKFLAATYEAKLAQATESRQEYLLNLARAAECSEHLMDCIRMGEEAGVSGMSFIQRFRDRANEVTAALAYAKGGEEGKNVADKARVRYLEERWRRARRDGMHYPGEVPSIETTSARCSYALQRLKQEGEAFYNSSWPPKETD